MSKFPLIAFLSGITLGSGFTLLIIPNLHCQQANQLAPKQDTLEYSTDDPFADSDDDLNNLDLNSTTDQHLILSLWYSEQASIVSELEQYTDYPFIPVSKTTATPEEVALDQVEFINSLSNQAL